MTRPARPIRRHDATARPWLTNLWSLVCQTCGEPLGSKADLSADGPIDGEKILISLHHSGCRPSGTTPPDSTTMSCPTTSFAAGYLAQPDGKPRHSDIPVIVINPSCEQLQLIRDASGTWCNATVDAFTGLGLTRPDGHPLPAVRDPELPRAARGDPDDLGTAAVAAFLAPAVIISKDSVFNRFGLALPADRWTEEAARLLVAAGYDAALEDAAHAAELAPGCCPGLSEPPENAAVRNPKAAITTAVIAGLAAWYCHRRGWITSEHVRAAAGRVASAARPLAERVAVADARRNQARAALTVVQGHGSASLEERCARHLARRPTAMTPAELSAALTASGTTVTTAAVRAVLTAHPAFTQDTQGGFILGRPARVPAISSGAQPPRRGP